MHLHVKQLLTENELKTGIRILTKPKMQEKSHENQVGPEKRHWLRTWTLEGILRKRRSIQVNL